ncbi:hypothetical protein ACFSKI_01800 [Pseudogracilibacillus auburnensis]|uniref:Uncharacterized protein n=1 Tax=Pseudogracilibacillus auburnensis TaxID=1494959 RepID=A0A2V3W256_9BACI|nr:hypothetical protein [Pseudogracilibacillus auburnensis]PXW87161.1 hypothetical protein DFR56_106231 [Pseudogracilibacillus auburnensis]
MIERNIRTSEKFLLISYFFILLFMLFHDWISLGVLNDIDAVKSVNSQKGLIMTTFINSIQIVILICLISLFVGKRYPIWAKLWLIIHPACIFIGVLISWWLPYFFGIGADEKAENYAMMFGDTHAFLPIRNGIQPNTIHVL